MKNYKLIVEYYEKGKTKRPYSYSFRVSETEKETLEKKRILTKGIVEDFEVLTLNTIELYASKIACQ